MMSDDAITGLNIADNSDPGDKELVHTG